MLDAADLLDLAADEIEVAGWYHGGGDFGPDGQAVCAVTSIARVHTNTQAPYAWKVSVKDALRRLVGFDDLAYWNDYVARDPHVVIDTMRACARGLR